MMGNAFLPTDLFDDTLLLLQLQYALRAAVNVTCPQVAGVLEHPKENVRPTLTKRFGADYICHAPIAMFPKLCTLARQSTQVSKETLAMRSPSVLYKSSDETAITIVSMSEMGTERHRTITSLSDLSSAIIEEIDPEIATSLFVDIRVDALSGEILIISRAHVAQQRAKGLLLCKLCGRFYSGEKGLRHHQQIKHNSTYEHAKYIAKNVSNTQLAIYSHQTLTWIYESDVTTNMSTQNLLPDKGLEYARTGNWNKLIHIIQHGWNPAVTDKHGSNALLWAAGGGHLDVCKYLVGECGVPADFRQKKDGRNALHWAARNGHIDCVRWLVERGVDVNLPTYNGTTAFHWAVWKGHLHMCRFLLEELHADFQSTNSFGCNAIQWAAQTGNVEMCAWLHDIGLDITLLNNNGHSAIHKAARKGNMDVCKWLIEEAGLGPSHLKADHEGNCPSDLARMEGHHELGVYLQGLEQRLTTTSNCMLDKSRNRISSTDLSDESITEKVKNIYQME